jgi:hypothetical protein
LDRAIASTCKAGNSLKDNFLYFLYRIIVINR